MHILHKLLPWLLFLLLCACSREQKPLILINDQAVPLAEFRQEIRPLQEELSQLPEVQQKLLLRQALSQLIDRKLLQAEAVRRGITIDAEEIQQALQEVRGNYTKTEYEDILIRSGQDPEDWKQKLRLRLLSEKVAARITRGKISLTDKQVEEYYLQHQEDYRHPEQLQARQIMLQSEEQANSLRNRILAGESFSELAARYSLSPDREAGGDLGLFAKGELPPEFDQVLFKLTPGRVSSPVKSPYGIHLFLVEKKRGAGVLPLDEVARSIRDKLLKEEENRRYHLWLQGLRKQANIEIDWEQLDKIHFDKAK